MNNTRFTGLVLAAALGAFLSMTLIGYMDFIVTHSAFPSGS